MPLLLAWKGMTSGAAFVFVWNEYLRRQTAAHSFQTVRLCEAESAYSFIFVDHECFVFIPDSPDVLPCGSLHVFSLKVCLFVLR